MSIKFIYNGVTATLKTKLGWSAFYKYVDLINSNLVLSLKMDVGLSPINYCSLCMFVYDEECQTSTGNIFKKTKHKK